jgi:hypothetical protein
MIDATYLRMSDLEFNKYTSNMTLDELIDVMCRIAECKGRVDTPGSYESFCRDRYDLHDTAVKRIKELSYRITHYESATRQ